MPGGRPPPHSKAHMDRTKGRCTAAAVHFLRMFQVFGFAFRFALARRKAIDSFAAHCAHGNVLKEAVSINALQRLPALHLPHQILSINRRQRGILVMSIRFSLGL